MMVRTALARAAALAALACLPLSSHAIFRAYLSSTGNDANPCTLQAPCRLLPKALTVVDEDGEIWMMDSANYNTTTVGVTKSVTILAVPGAVGSVVAPTNEPAIDVTAPGVSVTLRNLVIVPLGVPGSSSGVRIPASAEGARVRIESARISRVVTGVNQLANNAELAVIDSNFLRVVEGVLVRQGRALVSRCHFVGSMSAGVVAAVAPGATRVDVHVNGTVATQGNNGFVAIATSAGQAATLYVRDSVASGNSGSGFYAFGGTGVAGIHVSNSASNDNAAYGFYAFSNAIIVSAGNNHVKGNASGATSGNFQTELPI